MRTLTLELGARGYPIRIGHGLLGNPHSFAEAHGRSCRLVTDRNVAAHYLEPVRNVLKLEPAHCLVLPAGEAQKTLENAGRVLDWLLESQLPRDGLVLALGGGVIGDLAGFAAAICQRGVDLVQLPTTLLAQVDSSVGGKTAINHALGKNMIGAFHQPCAVVADVAVLDTLPDRELRAGLAEVIKHAVALDVPFMEWLEKNIEKLLARERDALVYAVRRCCELKAGIVASDEREAGVRALLNFGHTFGHAIEAGAGYGTWLHGEAIAAGMVMGAELSMRLGLIGRVEVERLRKLIARAGLPVKGPVLAPEKLMALMALDETVGDSSMIHKSRTI